jgi:hypothetical protein
MKNSVVGTAYKKVKERAIEIGFEYVKPNYFVTKSVAIASNKVAIHCWRGNEK